MNAAVILKGDSSGPVSCFSGRMSPINLVLRECAVYSPYRPGAGSMPESLVWQRGIFQKFPRLTLPRCHRSQEGPEDTWRTVSRSLPGSTGGILVAQAEARVRRPPQHDVPCPARAARHAAICGGQFVPWWWGEHSDLSSPRRTLKLFNSSYLA